MRVKQHYLEDDIYYEDLGISPMVDDEGWIESTVLMPNGDPYRYRKIREFGFKCRHQKSR